MIVAILAALAVPAFLRQRQKAWEAQEKAAVKSAVTAVEAYGVEHGGDFSGLDGKVDADLRPVGYNPTDGVTINVRASGVAYCVTAHHARLDDELKYASAVGRPEPGSCVDANG